MLQNIQLTDSKLRELVEHCQMLEDSLLAAKTAYDWLDGLAQSSPISYHAVLEKRMDEVLHNSGFTLAYQRGILRVSGKGRRLVAEKASIHNLTQYSAGKAWYDDCLVPIIKEAFLINAARSP